MAPAWEVGTDTQLGQHHVQTGSQCRVSSPASSLETSPRTSAVSAGMSAGMGPGGRLPSRTDTTIEMNSWPLKGIWEVIASQTTTPSTYMSLFFEYFGAWWC